MAPQPTITYRNQLLDALSPSDLALLAPSLTSVDLELRGELERPNRPIKNVFFPEAGMVSVVAKGMHGKELEVGVIGREGMTGLMVVLGNDRSPYLSYTQIAGNAQRIKADDLRAAMLQRPQLAAVFLRYVQAFMIQTTQTAISNGSGKLEERLARWLLMAHDRVDGDNLPMIHDFLALMLGVRRPGVTVALHSLEAQGLIKPGRATVTILDRQGLEKVAKSSYGIPEEEYKRRMQ